jgi:Domain of unknown function (DUF4184)
MPFTISHAAAVLPFARPLARWRLLSAAVIGSMVPDFGFLMPWRPARIETHSAISLLTFCLPVGLATFWVFQQLIKRSVVAVLPDATYARWHGFAAPADIGSLKQWVLGAAGVLVGAVTHLVWDGFTHEGARGVRMIPALDDPIVDIAGHRLGGARLLQDVSSLVGLVIVLAILAYGLRRGRRTDTLPVRSLRPGERYVWIFLYAATSASLAGLSLFLRHPFHPASQSLSIMVGNCAIAALRGFAGALVGVSLCLRVRLRADP